VAEAGIEVGCFWRMEGPTESCWCKQVVAPKASRRGEREQEKGGRRWERQV